MTRNKSFDNKNPVLYMVATPIGNLNEMSKRALDIFNESDLIAAEDTRNTRSLLANYGIHKEMFSLHEHNETEGAMKVISMMKEGKKVAYCSDAGYPGISDPGAILVRKCIENGISVSTVCGSCAFINALVASGLPTDHFYFYGFLSSKESQAKEEIQELSKRKETVILYESPHRIAKTLINLYEGFGNREVTLARELTKLNEEYIRGTLGELKDIDITTLKGEMVIILKGSDEEAKVTEEELLRRVNYLKEKGMSTKDAVEVTAEEYKMNKNAVYRLAQQTK